MEIIRAEYEQMNKRRQGIVYTEQEKSLIKAIKQGTILENRDNISRTHAYKEYYLRNCEIRWSFLASMVSRNAGWNMTDLEGKYYPKILPQQVRKRLFLTYERANWYIFSDAYPQLLLYEESKQAEKPLFHLLKAFSVSVFMEAEWERYWYEKDDNRLMTALIINEQQMIQRPVIEHPFFQKHVFHSLLFKVQELFHFSSVLFPTIQGKLYGFSVSDFERLSKRVELGKRLAWLLFCPRYQEGFQRFSDETVHTGSRRDYEQYFPFTKEQDTPYLRDVFPVIPHQRYVENDWYNTDVDLESLFSFEAPQQPFDLTDWFMIKQKQLHVLIEVQDFFLMKGKNRFLCRMKTSFVSQEGSGNMRVEIDTHESNEGGFIMKIVPMDDVLNGMDRLLSALDLLEMNVTLRVNHTVKHKEDEVMDDIEVVNMHLTHLDSKLEHHLKKGSWLHKLETLAAIY